MASVSSETNWLSDAIDILWMPTASDIFEVRGFQWRDAPTALATSASLKYQVPSILAASTLSVRPSSNSITNTSPTASALRRSTSATAAAANAVVRGAALIPGPRRRVRCA